MQEKGVRKGVRQNMGEFWRVGDLFEMLKKEGIQRGWLFEGELLGEWENMVVNYRKSPEPTKRRFYSNESISILTL